MKTAPASTGFGAVRWSGQTRGGYWGNWFFLQMIRFLGLWSAYVWLVFVAAFFTLASPSTFRCSAQYLRRLLSPRPFWAWPWLVYRHLYSFGITLLDRSAVIMGRSRMQCAFDGESELRRFLDQGQGIILVGAHVGNWELGGHFLGRLGKPVNLVVLEKEAPRIRALFDRALQERMFRILTADDHPLRSIPILAALRRGEMVALHGDRSFGRGDLAVPFLGGTARFPVGAYLLAAVSGAPIFQVFALREKLGQYRFISFPAQFVGKEALGRDPDVLRGHVAQYAERLAWVVRQYPFQWYNLYPFWEDTPADSSPEAAA